MDRRPSRRACRRQTVWQLDEARTLIGRGERGEREGSSKGRDAIIQLSRYCAGVVPIRFLKWRKKFLRPRQPTVARTDSTLSPCRRRSAA